MLREDVKCTFDTKTFGSISGQIYVPFGHARSGYHQYSDSKNPIASNYEDLEAIRKMAAYIRDELLRLRSPTFWSCVAVHEQLESEIQQARLRLTARPTAILE